jgi:DNA modification methylase
VTCGLRDYGLPPVEWEPVTYRPMPGLAEVTVPGCEAGCEHVWGDDAVTKVGGGYSGKSTLAGFTSPDTKGRQMNQEERVTSGQFCQRCGGWRGSLGLEPTPEMYVGHIVAVWRELWRVLRDDGCCFGNWGDSYFGGGYANHKVNGPEWLEAHGGDRRKSRQQDRIRDNQALKPKDLIGIPWRVAFALQADGWFLRSSIIWAKGISFCPTYSGSCMPESVRDRPTKGHEDVFLLTKRARYFYDGEAVKEASQGDGRKRGHITTNHRGNGAGRNDGGRQLQDDETDGKRNLRSVWAISPSGYPGSHFAVFPPALISPMIRAGTSERGACPTCGSPWERTVERTNESNWQFRKEKGAIGGSMEKGAGQQIGTGWSHDLPSRDTITTGWRPTCSCRVPVPCVCGGKSPKCLICDGTGQAPTIPEPVPCVILDPFFGSGTTGQVSNELGRECWGIDLSQEYLPLQLERTAEIEMRLFQ